MTNIVVFGNGMLATYVARFFNQFPEYRVIVFTRNNIGDFREITSIGKLSSKIDRILGFDGKFVFVNAAGVIKPQVDKVGKLSTIQINSVLPHIIANFCEVFHFKFIHASTDCTFGYSGNYKVSDIHDCEDLYGRSKSLGEPDNAIVIKTSIIGEEVDQARSLVEWVKSNAGKTINGFTNHWWNGNSCLQWAKFAKHCIDNDIPYFTYHLTGQTVTKYELLRQINEVYNLGITVNPTEDCVSIDRTLVSNCKHLYAVPPLQQQLEEMKTFSPILHGI